MTTTTSSPNRVTAVVVSRGATAHLPLTLAAIGVQETPPDQVILVDVSAAAELPEATVHAPSAKTFGQAVQAGIAATGIESEWLWLLHDDAAPKPDALAAQLRAIGYSANVGVVGPKQRSWPWAQGVEGDETVPADPATAEGYLLEVGHTVSPLGRRMTGVDDTEIDQGQHDSREDVLAVGMAGALVRFDVWTSLRGTDPQYGFYGDGLDFCRRVWRAGYRVIVVPEAVVNHAQTILRAGTAEPYGLLRRSQLRHRLVHVSGWLMPFSFLAMILWAPFAALWQVIHKEPAKASGEISAAASNFVRLPSLLKARFRNARSAKVPRSTLKPLLATPREVWRERRDLRLARAEAKRVASGPTELQKQELKALAGPRRAGLAFVLVTSLVAALATFGPWLGSLLAGGRFAGGALLPATGNLADVWQAATSGWNFGNLGASVPGDPLLLTLVPLTAVAGGSLQLAVNLALLLALPLAALGAWFAAGALTRTVWVRIVAALSWAACAGMLLILGDGLLGALVTQLALPWLLLAVVRALGLQATDGTSERAIREEVRALSEPGVPTKYSSEARNFEGWEGAEPAGDPATDAQESKPRKGSLAAACLASLWLAVVVSGAPVLLPVALVLILVGLFFAGRSRWLLLLLPIPAMVLGAPWWWRVFQTGAIPGNTDGLITPVVSDRNLRPLFEAPLSNPTYVLQDSVANADPLSGLALLLGQPTLPETWRTDFPWALAPAILLGAVILIAALVALVISWFSGVSARAFGATQPPQTEAVGRVAAQRRVKTTAGIAFLFIATAGGLGIALMAVALGVAPTAGVSLITLSLGAAAVLVSGVSLRSYAAAPPPYTRRFAATQPPEVGTSRSAALRVLRGVGIALLVALPISSLVTGLVVARDGSHLGHVQVSTESVVPAVGRQMQASGQRILQVSTRGFDTPLRGYSTAGTTTAGTDGATADALTEWTLLRADGSSLLDASVLARDLDAGQSTLTQLVGELAGGQSGDVVARLASNGIGAVQVPATERGELVTTLDLTPGLERVTEGEGVLLWRVVTDVTALAPSPNFPERHLWLVVSAVTVAAFALLALPLGRKDSDA